MGSRSGRVFEDVVHDTEEPWAGEVLVGGMASAPDDLDIARSYVEAAELLVGEALESKEEWRLTYPILFLYRHALELYLKAAVHPESRSHDLGPLMNRLDKALRQRSEAGIPPSMKKDLLALSAIDKDGQGFRYARDTKGNRRLLPGENRVDLSELRRLMESFFRGVERFVNQGYGRT